MISALVLEMAQDQLGLENAFEPLEALVTELATDVDRKLQLQYDTARLLR